MRNNGVLKCPPPLVAEKSLAHSSVPVATTTRMCVSEPPPSRAIHNLDFYCLGLILGDFTSLVTLPRFLDIAVLDGWENAARRIPVPCLYVCSCLPLR